MIDDETEDKASSYKSIKEEQSEEDKEDKDDWDQKEDKKEDANQDSKKEENSDILQFDTFLDNSLKIPKLKPRDRSLSLQKTLSV